MLKGQTGPDHYSRTSDKEPWYRALRFNHPEEYQKTIMYMEGVMIQKTVPSKIASEYEQAAVMLVCEILGVEP